MKLSLNINTAMILRKRINQLIADVYNDITTKPLIVVDEMYDEYVNSFRYGTFEKTLEVYKLAHIASRDLTDAIDSANERGRVYLNTINHINRHICDLSMLNNKLKGQLKQRSRHPVTGEWEETRLRKLTEVNLEKDIKELEFQKRRMEDMLSKWNGTQEFNFELDDAIYAELYGTEA